MKPQLPSDQQAIGDQAASVTPTDNQQRNRAGREWNGRLSFTGEIMTGHT